MKLTKILAASAAAAACSVALSAFAQETAEPPKPKFTKDVAAECVAAMYHLQQIPPFDDQTVAQARAMEENKQVGYVIWMYELRVNMLEADEETFKKAIQGGLDKLATKLPEAESEDAAKKYLETIFGKANECGEKIEAAYPEGPHPAIILMARAQQQAMQQRQQQQQQDGGMAPIGE